RFLRREGRKHLGSHHGCGSFGFFSSKKSQRQLDSRTLPIHRDALACQQQRCPAPSETRHKEMDTTASPRSLRLGFSLCPQRRPVPPPRCHACNVCLGVCAVLLFVLSALFAGMMTFHTFRRVEYVGRLLRDVVNETRRLDVNAAAATLDASSSPLPEPGDELGPTRADTDHEGVAIDNGTGAHLGRLRQ
ncbi:hypothetical protein MTO96_032658, partial [Rhipicephalus appendiculatus]